MRQRAAAQVVTNPWLRRFLDLECFVLSGMPAADTITAEMAFMFMERNKAGSSIDYPLGGGGAIVDALVCGIEKNGGHVELRAHVEGVLVEEGRAAGVRLRPRGSRAPQGEVRCTALPRCLHPVRAARLCRRDARCSSCGVQVRGSTPPLLLTPHATAQARFARKYA
jgi:phytoene dehydrogenase-like protein